MNGKYSESIRKLMAYYFWCFYGKCHQIENTNDPSVVLKLSNEAAMYMRQFCSFMAPEDYAVYRSKMIEKYKDKPMFLYIAGCL